MAENRNRTTDGEPPIRPVEKISNYTVYSCDGFSTSFLTNRIQTAFQFSFWMDDVTPTSENMTKDLQDTDYFTAPLRKLFQTSIKINPNLALQLALNIIENLSKLSNDVKDRYDIPRYPSPV